MWSIQRIHYLQGVIKYNFHTHSSYSDGSAEPEEYVIQAIREGFTDLGFSEHAPLAVTPNTFALREDKVEEYVRVIRDLQEKYKDSITLHAGMEMDYILGISGNFATNAVRWGLDYVIGSVHLVPGENEEGLWFIDGPDQRIYDEGLLKFFGGDIRKAIEAYYLQVKKMILTEDFDIVGHLDKVRMHNKNRFFQDEEGWYRELVLDVLDEIAKRKLVVEVNTRGLYKKRNDQLFPATWVLKEILKRDISILLSSDAHKPEEVSNLLNESFVALKEIGFKTHQLKAINPHQIFKERGRINSKPR